jgi:DNA-binding CsgD family transcriptional regulator
MSFKQDSFVKILDTHGNFRYGFICATKERGYVLVIDMNEEGYSKINWDSEYAQNVGTELNFLKTRKDFNEYLTETEKKIVVMLAEEHTSQEVAEALQVSPVSVRCHIRDLKNKLQVDTREQLCAYCQGIVKVLE